MAQITIKKVTKFNKCAKVEHDGGSLMFWLSDAFADDLTEGATVNVSAEDKPNKDGTGTDKWIKTVNGKEAKAKGGGRAYQPKSAAEIHASCIAGLLKTCREMSPAPKEGKEIDDARAWCNLYWEQVGKVNG